MATATRLMTAEEFALLPETGVIRELVRGEVVELNQPYPRHGDVCAAIVEYVRPFARLHNLGRVVSNDSGIITERDPDTVRGGDVSFFSYAKISPGPLRQGYLDVPPSIVFEVNSPWERWPYILRKVAEYLEVGVEVVCVLDPDDETVRLYYADRPEVILSGDDTVTFPDQLPGFEVAASRFFD